ncbi:hypothetical protein [Halorubrum sp. SD626R]|uniref:hypothetical protein n=1 Tax=Halorubrum sp. SD626R TaxID=1419722 RepID=UPI0010F708D5|nr:hypothetical protein [Halorubrum sp. SD626R]TKX79912.1 hypothetical protein EXE53_13495 [Halorubrum sp. SD626R]
MTIECVPVDAPEYYQSLRDEDHFVCTRWVRGEDNGGRLVGGGVDVVRVPVLSVPNDVAVSLTNGDRVDVASELSAGEFNEFVDECETVLDDVEKPLPPYCEAHLYGEPAVVQRTLNNLYEVYVNDNMVFVAAYGFDDGWVRQGLDRHTAEGLFTGDWPGE